MYLHIFYYFDRHKNKIFQKKNFDLIVEGEPNIDLLDIYPLKDTLENF